MYLQRIALMLACCVATLLVLTCPAGTSAVSIVSGSANRTFVPSARVERAARFGDQCPDDFIKDYEKNEDICRRCTEYYDGDERMGNLCRQNCFTSCYYVECKNILECHIPYPLN